ncbi:MAG: cadherin-like beta sandwich domain-containing protein, partial [Bacteroidales bacterium]
AYGQFAFEYSTDGETWTAFDKDNLVTGDLYGGGWQYLTFSEVLPAVEELSIKVYRTAAQIHMDDLILMGEPTISNALIKTLSLDVGDVDFAYYTNDYQVWVPYGTTETPVITAETFDGDATVVVTDAADITSATEADRTSTVVVTAEDGTTTNTYNLVFNVTPPRTDSRLSGINLSYATLAPDFSPDIQKYLVDLPDTATVAPEITPVLADADGASFDLTMPADISSDTEADRTASIVVTAQDGVTTSTYEVVFKVGGGSKDLFVMDIETFGDVGNKFGVVLNTYEGFTSDFIWGDQMVAIRTSNPSNGYDLASGANRIEVQAGWGTGYDTLVFQANTSAYSNVTLAMGAYTNSGFERGAEVAFRGYYSTDSVTWTSLGKELQGGTEWPGSNLWSYVILDDVLPTDDTLYIMLANEDANHEYWLDDITLWGTPLNTNNQLAGIAVSEGTLDPEFDPNVTSYTVALPQGSSETPTVTPTVLSPSAVIDQVDAPDIRSLDIADNTTTITVTAEDGSSRTYEIVFDVFKSSDARLKELSVGDLPLSPGFSNDISGYAVKLPAGTTEAPDITAVAEDDFATVTVTPPIDINSSDVADRTAFVEVVAEDEVSMLSFEIVFTFGSLADVRFNIMQEEFNGTGTFEAENYPGYTSGATFDGDEHKWDNTNSETYPLASGGAAMKFGEWGANPAFVEMVMKQKIEGYQTIMLSFGIQHNSGGWGDGGCGLTNNFTMIEYTVDSVTWVTLNRDSTIEGSMNWPCGDQPFSFIELAEEIPVDDEGYVTIRISHS